VDDQLQQLSARQSAPQDSFALRVDTVNLENIFCQIKPNNRYLLDVTLLSDSSAENFPRGGEPSTTSQSVIRRGDGKS
jgi:hypothetical protein